MGFPLSVNASSIRTSRMVRSSLQRFATYHGGVSLSTVAVTSPRSLGSTRTRVESGATRSYPTMIFAHSNLPLMLDMNVIKNIKHDMEKVDSDQDGKVNFEDFKSWLLHDYAHLFNDREVEEIGELLFVGGSGHSIKTSVLVRGICHVAQQDLSQDVSFLKKTWTPPEKENPLHLVSLEDFRAKIDPRDHIQPFYTTQDVFDTYMKRYINEKS